MAQEEAAALKTQLEAERAAVVRFVFLWCSVVYFGEASMKLTRSDIHPHKPTAPQAEAQAGRAALEAELAAATAQAAELARQVEGAEAAKVQAEAEAT